MPGVDSILERVFMKSQAAIRTLTNTGGTADIAGADAVQHSKIVLKNAQNLIERNNKHGTKSPLIGVAGRRSGSWEYGADITPSGAGGTAPDQDPLFESAFGVVGSAPTGTATIASTAADGGTGEIVVTTTAGHSFANGDLVVITGANNETNRAWVIKAAAGSVFTLRGSVWSANPAAGSVTKASTKYVLSDDQLLFELWKFETSETLENEVGVGCIVRELSMEFGQEAPATMQASGECGWVLSDYTFDDAEVTDTEKAGLDAFPSEPTSPVVNGTIIPAHIGHLSVNDLPFVDTETFGLTFTPGGEVAKDTIGENLPNDAQAPRRETTVRLRTKDTAAAGVEGLVTKALRATPVDVIYRCGDTPGNMVVILARNVQFEPGDRDDNDLKFKRDYTGTAHGSSTTAVDELTIWFA